MTNPEEQSKLAGTQTRKSGDRDLGKDGAKEQRTSRCYLEFTEAKTSHDKDGCVFTRKTD